MQVQPGQGMGAPRGSAAVGLGEEWASPSRWWPTEGGGARPRSGEQDQGAKVAAVPDLTAIAGEGGGDALFF